MNIPNLSSKLFNDQKMVNDSSEHNTESEQAQHNDELGAKNDQEINLEPLRI